MTPTSRATAACSSYTCSLSCSRVIFTPFGVNCPHLPTPHLASLPNTASALSLVSAVGRPNLGLTLDTGHLLMAGECLAQSVAEVAAAGRLFGLHLNDGHGRLGAEDGLVFGSVHGAAALELMYYLRCGMRFRMRMAATWPCAWPVC